MSWRYGQTSEAGQVQQFMSGLKSLGPKSQQMLARAGIATDSQLRHLGAVRAYLQTKKCNPSASLNLLWGLESALSGVHWREVARVHRASLLLALEDVEKNVSPKLEAPARKRMRE